VGFRALADAAVVLHFGFLVFLVVGGLLALRWRAVLWLHLASVVWSVGILTVGQRCPLTALEHWANGRAGGAPYDGGFIDRYVEGVVYPGSLTGVVRALVAVVVVGSWVAVWRQSRTGRATAPVPAPAVEATAGRQEGVKGSEAWVAAPP